MTETYPLPKVAHLREIERCDAPVLPVLLYKQTIVDVFCCAATSSMRALSCCYGNSIQDVNPRL